MNKNIELANQANDTLPKIKITAKNDQLVKSHHDPTRYGDWEKNGRAIDF